MKGVSSWTFPAQADLPSANDVFKFNYDTASLGEGGLRMEDG